MPTNFPALRHHRQAQIAANDAMVGLIIGIELGQQALVGHADHERLVDIHPDIPSKARLNQNVAEVGGVLADAERQMAYMSIPYAISIYQRLIGDALELLERDGHPISGNPHQLDFPDAHKSFSETCGVELPAAELRAFNFARHLRNRLTHHRGIAGPKLRSEWLEAKLGAGEDDGQALWIGIAGRAFPVVGAREELDLGSGELFAVLAITKRLADTVQLALVEILSAGVLAEIIVADYRDRYPRRFEQVGKRQRRLRGYRRSQYPHLASVSADDLEAATATIVENGGGSA